VQKRSANVVTVADAFCAKAQCQRSDSDTTIKLESNDNDKVFLIITSFLVQSLIFVVLKMNTTNILIQSNMSPKK